MNEDLTKLRHDRSKKDFPGLTLDKDEYVELSISRAKIGLLLVWAGELCGFAVIALFLGLFLHTASETPLLMLLLLIIFGVLIITGLVGTIVYTNNKMFITNKRVLQYTMSSLFAKSANIIELSVIEDVSFKQNGVFENLFKIGTIRMSTVSDETTYTFEFAGKPSDELEKISKLVHDAKNAKKAEPQEK